MTSLANQLKATLPASNKGLAEIDKYKGVRIPLEQYEITQTLGDIIMAEYCDCDDTGDFIERDGILVSNDISQHTWRFAEVKIAGTGCSEEIKPGVIIMFPSDKGIPIVIRGEKPKVFLNEERIFGICKKKA